MTTPSAPNKPSELDEFEISLAPLEEDGHDSAGIAQDDDRPADVRRWAGRMLGEYRLERLIGQGSSGFVFLAHDHILRRRVAIKVLSRREVPEDPANARLIGMFVKEARVAATMNHPHCVHIYSVASLDGWWYMAMEYLEGGTLGELLRKAGPMAYPQACRYGGEAASALCNAHDLGIVHRDVKPGNLMLTGSGHCKVVDFGFAQDPGAQGAGKHNLVGTPLYMAPEVTNRQPATAKSDVYSLGVTLYALLSGEKPFEAQDVESLYRMHREKTPPDLQQSCPHLPAPLCGLVMRMLAKDPDARPNMPTVARALRSLAHMGETGVMANSLSASAWDNMSLSLGQAGGSPASRRKAWLPWAIGAALAAGVAATAILLLRPAAPAEDPQAKARAEAAAKESAERTRELEAIRQQLEAMKSEGSKAQEAAKLAAQEAAAAQAKLAAANELAAQQAREAKEAAARAERDRLVAANAEANAKAEEKARQLRAEVEKAQAEAAAAKARAAEAQAAQAKAAEDIRRAEAETQAAKARAAEAQIAQAKTAEAAKAAPAANAKTQSNRFGMTFAFVPGGAFQMGTPAAEQGHHNNEQAHPVTLSHGFWMGATEVSVAQFRAVMGAQWKSADGEVRGEAAANRDPAAPMVFVSWNDARAFCRRLSELEGKNYRLPTEAEWEFACRAGSAEAFSSGPQPPQGTVAGAAALGACESGKPNAFGLFNMHGNAAEWCADWYAPYSANAAADPSGPANAPDPDLGARVVRGGSWKQDARFSRSGARGFQMPVIKNAFTGLRVVQDAPPPSR